MATMKECLLTKLSDPAEHSGHRVTVVGTGSVGMACAMCLLTQGVTNDICLIDSMEEKLQGELMDMQHGALFLGCPKLQGGKDYALSACSKVIIITAGVRQKQGESRLALVQRNTDVMKTIIPQLLKHSPDAILLLVTNPVDIMTYVAWKVSGLPKSRVIGSGTNLDTSRFRFFISEKLGVSPASVHGWIIGEHGDTSVPVWSGVNVAGVNLIDLNPDLGSDKDPEGWNVIHTKVVKAAYEVIKRKGYTSWAVALSCTAIVKSILKNTNNVHGVSTYIKGQHGIESDVFLSLPAVLGGTGITKIIQQKLTDAETKALQESAAAIEEIQKDLGLHGIEDEVFLTLPSVLNLNGISSVVKQPLNEDERKALLKSAASMTEVIKDLDL